MMETTAPNKLFSNTDHLLRLIYLGMLINR